MRRPGIASVLCAIALGATILSRHQLRAEIVLSNLGQGSSGFGFGAGTNAPATGANLMRAETFQTGINSKGYRLNSVTLGMGGSTGSGLGDFVLQLYAAGPFQPTTSLGNFTVPSNPLATGQYTYVFPNTSLVLAPQTYYAIVVRSPGSVGPTISQYGWRTVSSGPDPISDPKWLFFDHLTNTEGQSTWLSTRSGHFQLSIDATAVPEPGTLVLIMGVFAGALLRRR